MLPAWKSLIWNCRAMYKVAVSLICVSDNPQILASQVYFWAHEQSKLELVHSQKMYPPRFTLRSSYTARTLLMMQLLWWNWNLKVVTRTWVQKSILVSPSSFKGIHSRRREGLSKMGGGYWKILYLDWGQVKVASHFISRLYRVCAPLFL